MHKTVLLLVAALVGFGSNSLFAVTKTLIDFNQYEQKIASEPAYAQDGGNAQQQQGSGAAATAATGEKIFKVTVDDMKLGNWLVILNSSSRQMNNIRHSYAQAVKTKGLVGGGPRTVLGARIHFPTWANIASAEIAPPYEFPTYTDSGSIASVENGVVDNTGDIYSITTEVYGRNFDYAFYIQLKDEFGQTTKYYMGQLFFDGWRKLAWKNPMYIDNVSLREIKRLPIFPDKGIPYQRLESFLIVKNQYAPGGNYLFYVANVAITYDLAVVAEDEDIDQEGTWHILADAMTELLAQKNKERSDLVELRRQEVKKMAMARGQENQQQGGQPRAAGNANAAAPAPAPAA